MTQEAIILDYELYMVTYARYVYIFSNKYKHYQLTSLSYELIRK